MVTVKHLCIVIVAIVQGSPQDLPSTKDPGWLAPAWEKKLYISILAKPQDTVDATPTSKPQNDNAYDYGDYDTDYGKQYTDYVKQYSDYVKQYGDYGVQYGDYGPSTSDYALYDHTWAYEDDYGMSDYDYTTDYSEYFVFGDRNNPLDTIMHVYDDHSGLQSQTPWVYIIVPVVQIDVLYVDPEHEKIEDIEMQFPIETFFFELGDFGMGHFDLGDFGLGDFDLGDFGVNDFRHAGDYGPVEDYGLAATYGEYNDYPLYGHYQGAKAGLYDTADELGDLETLDYPGIDHDPYWIDWIFMIPPDEMAPGLR